MKCIKVADDSIMLYILCGITNCIRRKFLVSILEVVLLGNVLSDYFEFAFCEVANTNYTVYSDLLSHQDSPYYKFEKKKKKKKNGDKRGSNRKYKKYKNIRHGLIESVPKHY